MRYFLVADPYDASEGELSKVVNELKVTEEGQKKMCKVMQEAYEMGAKRGKEIWFEEGLEQGEKRGLEKGQKSMARLTECMLNDGRVNELRRCLVNEAIAQKYMAHYGIL